MKELKDLFKNNLKWVETQTRKNPDYFKSLAKDQDPKYLWIGCSDSRVPANQVVGLNPGELFVHRNLANLCPHTDFNCLSVLEFAVNILKVRHVIVCGHYDCGGIRAAMEDHHLGLVDNWLRNIKDVYASHKDLLDSIKDLKKRCNKLVELNVAQQVLNVCHTTIVQKAWGDGQPLSIHGWVYDLASGRLKDLNLCLSKLEQIASIYHVQFPSQ